MSGSTYTTFWYYGPEGEERKLTVDRETSVIIEKTVCRKRDGYVILDDLRARHLLHCLNGDDIGYEISGGNIRLSAEEKIKVLKGLKAVYAGKNKIFATVK